ncbi:carbohydrate ABC transporter permease [Pseudarthrobacter sp. SSS035]|uniref:carbohydrate ABC transporter permease n=1 Tax=Pseudarthrobacter sp. SSS035 TaxID=2931399 RepID=UPI00200C6A74|nr:carbohydrate ABC transporter permease [Pseudarthrobacter sp. SSS035]
MITRILRITVLAVLGLLWLLPVYLLITNAAKSSSDYSGDTLWLPGNILDLGDNLVRVFTKTEIPQSLANTALYSITGPLIAVILGAAVGFAVIVLRLRNGFLWFFVIYIGSVFPLQMMVIPLFDTYSRVGLYNTSAGMIFVYSVVCLPFSAFVMRNFFSGIADSVFEAAVVDGAGAWRIFTRIYLPMSSSALAVVFILQATWVWNDLLLGLVLTQGPETRNVMPVLAGLQATQGGGGESYTVVLTAALLVSIPTTVLFVVSQRYFSKGLSLGQY